MQSEINTSRWARERIAGDGQRVGRDRVGGANVCCSAAFCFATILSLMTIVSLMLLPVFSSKRISCCGGDSPTTLQPSVFFKTSLVKVSVAPGMLLSSFASARLTLIEYSSCVTRSAGIRKVFYSASIRENQIMKKVTSFSIIFLLWGCTAL